jgi:hypothetical protein
MIKIITAHWKLLITDCKLFIKPQPERLFRMRSGIDSLLPDVGMLLGKAKQQGLLGIYMYTV